MVVKKKRAKKEKKSSKLTLEYPEVTLDSYIAHTYQGVTQKFWGDGILKELRKM